MLSAILKENDFSSELFEEGSYGTFLRHLASKGGRSGQLEGIYQIQQYCHDRDFPKTDEGAEIEMIFRSLYNEDIIEEDAFIEWKDDVGNPTPGKMKAIIQVKLLSSSLVHHWELFQTTEWLVWLEEAEEEEDDEEDEVE